MEGRAISLVVAVFAATLMVIAPAVAVEPQAHVTQTPADLDAMGLERPPAADTEGAPAVPKGIRAVVEATLVVQDGASPPGASGVVSTLRTPFVNGNGAVGFTGDVDVDDDFVWFDAGVVWSNSDALPTVLSGAEDTMGISNTGGFIYSPATDSEDSVWTHGGLLAVENVQAPGMPAGVNSTFHSRPTMIPTGQAYWVAGHNDGAGGNLVRGADPLHQQRRDAGEHRHRPQDR